MQILLSPSKTMDMSPIEVDCTTPLYADRADYLASILRSLSFDNLKALMGTSDKLTETTQGKLAQLAPMDTHNGKAALYSYTGEVYKGLDPLSLEKETLRAAQKQVIILSGMYGMLRPLDRIQEYRLEMGARLENTAGSNLYAYWKKNITEGLNQHAHTHNHTYLINLASSEYFKALDKKTLKPTVIDVEFREEKNGKLKVISTFSKRARGCMTRYFVEQNIQNPEDMKSFDVDGYVYREDLSTDVKYVYTR